MGINQDAKRFAPPSAISSFFCVVALLMVSVPQMKAAFSTPTPLVSSPTDTSDQHVATSGSNVFLVWRDNEIGANPEIYFIRSTNGGVTFEAPQNISQSPSFSGNPRIAASGQHVYITFSDAGGTFLAHSENGGLSFLPNTNLTAAFGFQLGSLGSWLAAAGENLYMVWRGGGIFMARFGNYSATFLGSQNLSASPYSIDPVVAASGNSVYVAWSEPVAGNENDILFRRSTDGGVAFDPVVNISNNSGLSRFPTMAADGMKVWLAWKDGTPLNDDILFARSADAGSLFEPTLNLSNNATGSVDPVVAARGNNVYVAWSDVPPGAASNLRDIYVTTSVDLGFSFDPTLVQNVSDSATGLSGAPRIAASDGVLAVYWGESLQAGIGTQRDIFYSYLNLSVPVPPPSMLSLSPSSGMQTQSVDVDLTGSGFQPGAVLALSGAGVTVTDVAFVSPTAMKAKMNVSLAALPGGRDLTLTNPDGQSATLNGAFTVMSASALMLIEITRADVNTGVSNGDFLNGSASYKSLLAHLANAESALLHQPADLAAAINEMDAFYIKICNLAKGTNPAINPTLYTTLYNDYAMVMASLGGTVKPAQ